MNEILLLKREWRLVYKVMGVFVFLFTCINFYCCIWYYIGRKSVFIFEIFEIEGGLNSWLLNDGNFGVINEMEVHL